VHSAEGIGAGSLDSDSALHCKKAMSKFDLASEARKPNAAGCRNFLTDAKFDSAPPLPHRSLKGFFLQCNQVMNKYAMLEDEATILR
jgi:hypothetical protein